MAGAGVVKAERTGSAGEDPRAAAQPDRTPVRTEDLGKSLEKDLFVAERGLKPAVSLAAEYGQLLGRTESELTGAEKKRLASLKSDLDTLKKKYESDPFLSRQVNEVLQQHEDRARLGQASIEASWYGFKIREAKGLFKQDDASKFERASEAYFASQKDMLARHSGAESTLRQHKAKSYNDLDAEIERAKFAASELKDSMDGVGTNTVKFDKATMGFNRRELEWTHKAFEKFTGSDLNTWIRWDFSFMSYESQRLANVDPLQAEKKALIVKLDAAALDKIVDVSKLREQTAGMLSEKREQKIAAALALSLSSDDPLKDAMAAFGQTKKEDRDAICAAFTLRNGKDYLEAVKAKVSPTEFAVIQSLVIDGKFSDRQILALLSERTQRIGCDDGVLKAGEGVPPQSATKAQDRRFEDTVLFYVKGNANSKELVANVTKLREEFSDRMAGSVMQAKVKELSAELGAARGEKVEDTERVERLKTSRKAYLDRLPPEMKADADRTMSEFEGYARSAQTSVEALHSAMLGANWWTLGTTSLGTDEKKVYANLKGKKAEELALICEIYQKKYGYDIRSHIIDEFGGPELDKAEALVKGDLAHAAAADVYMGMTWNNWWNGIDMEKTMREVKAMPKSEQKRVDDRFNEQYAERVGIQFEATVVNIQDGLDAAFVGKKGDVGSSDSHKIFSGIYNGDDMGVACAKVHQKLEYWNTPEAEIFALLEELGKENKELTGEKLTRYLGSLSETYPGLAEKFSAEVKEPTAKNIEEFLKKHEGDVKGTSLSHTVYRKLAEENKEINAAAVTEFVARYKAENNGLHIRTHLYRAMGGNELECALELANPEGRRSRADQFKLRYAAGVNYDGTDEGLMAETLQISDDLESLPATHPRRVAALEYQREHNQRIKGEFTRGESLDQMFTRELGSREWGWVARAAMQRRFENGRLNDAEAIVEACGTWYDGTADDVLYKRTRGKTKAEIAQMKADFKEFTASIPGYGDYSMELLIGGYSSGVAYYVPRGETSGRTRFDILENLQGVPETKDEFVAKAIRRRDFEDSGWLNPVANYTVFGAAALAMGGPIDLTGQGEVNRTTEELIRFAERMEDTPEDKVRMRALFHHMEMAADASKETKEAIDGAARLIGTTAVVIGVGFVTAGWGDTVLIPLLCVEVGKTTAMIAAVSFASLATNATIGYAVLGDSYGYESFARDGAFAAIDGVSVGTFSQLAPAAANRLAVMLAEEGTMMHAATALAVRTVIQGGVSEYIAGGLQSAITQDWNRPFEDVILDIQQAAATRAAIGIVASGGMEGLQYGYQSVAARFAPVAPVVVEANVHTVSPNAPQGTGHVVDVDVHAPPQTVHAETVHPTPVDGPHSGPIDTPPAGGPVDVFDVPSGGQPQQVHIVEVHPNAPIVEPTQLDLPNGTGAEIDLGAPGQSTRAVASGQSDVPTTVETVPMAHTQGTPDVEIVQAQPVSGDLGTRTHTGQGAHRSPALDVFNGQPIFAGIDPTIQLGPDGLPIAALKSAPIDVDALPASARAEASAPRVPDAESGGVVIDQKSPAAPLAVASAVAEPVVLSAQSLAKAPADVNAPAAKSTSASAAVDANAPTAPTGQTGQTAPVTQAAPVEVNAPAAKSSTAPADANAPSKTTPAKPTPEPAPVKVSTAPAKGPNAKIDLTDPADFAAELTKAREVLGLNPDVMPTRKELQDAIDAARRGAEYREMPLAKARVDAAEDFLYRLDRFSPPKGNGPAAAWPPKLEPGDVAPPTPTQRVKPRRGQQAQTPTEPEGAITFEAALGKAAKNAAENAKLSPAQVQAQQDYFDAKKLLGLTSKDGLGEVASLGPTLDAKYKAACALSPEKIPELTAARDYLKDMWTRPSTGVDSGRLPANGKMKLKSLAERTEAARANPPPDPNAPKVVTDPADPKTQGKGELDPADLKQKTGTPDPGPAPAPRPVTPKPAVDLTDEAQFATNFNRARGALNLKGDKMPTAQEVETAFDKIFRSKEYERFAEVRARANSARDFFQKLDTPEGTTAIPKKAAPGKGEPYEVLYEQHLKDTAPGITKKRLAAERAYVAAKEDLGFGPCEPLNTRLANNLDDRVVAAINADPTRAAEILASRDHVQDLWENLAKEKPKNAGGKAKKTEPVYREPTDPILDSRQKRVDFYKQKYDAYKKLGMEVDPLHEPVITPEELATRYQRALARNPGDKPEIDLAYQRARSQVPKTKLPVPEVPTTSWQNFWGAVASAPGTIKDTIVNFVRLIPVNLVFPERLLAFMSDGASFLPQQLRAPFSNMAEFTDNISLWWRSFKKASAPPRLNYGNMGSATDFELPAARPTVLHTAGVGLAALALNVPTVPIALWLKGQLANDPEQPNRETGPIETIQGNLNTYALWKNVYYPRLADLTGGKLPGFNDIPGATAVTEFVYDYMGWKQEQTPTAPGAKPPLPSVTDQPGLNGGGGNLTPLNQPVEAVPENGGRFRRREENWQPENVKPQADTLDNYKQSSIQDPAAKILSESIAQSALRTVGKDRNGLDESSASSVASADLRFGGLELPRAKVS